MAAKLANLVNEHHPLSRGLVAFWAPVAGSVWPTTWKDSAGRNHLTGVSRAISAKGGLQFNGSSDAVSVANVPYYAEFTFSAWFRYDGVSSGSFRSIGSRINAFGSPADWFLYSTGGAMVVDIPWVAGAVVTGSTSLTVGQWFHAGLVRSGSTGNWTYKIFYNGAVDGTATGVTSNPDTANHKLWLAALDATNFTGCAYGGVTLHNRALADNDMRMLYLESLKGYPSLIQRYKLGAYDIIAGGGSPVGSLINKSRLLESVLHSSPLIA